MVGLSRFFLIGVLALLVAHRAPAAERIDRVLAMVGSSVITESDVRAAIAFGLVQPPRLDQDPVRTTLDQLIRRQLILGEVARSVAAEPDQGQIAKRLTIVKARFASPAAFDAKLGETAMNETRLRDILDADIRIDEYMRQRFGAVVEPGEEEVLAYYQAHAAEFTSGGRQLSFDQVKSTARQRLIEERRAQLIDDWVARLRRRTEVTDLYFAVPGS